MEYYASDPASRDTMWAAEVASVSYWLEGRGLDPGAGTRTYAAETVRADLFAAHRPHVRADAAALPFRTGAFDYVLNLHLVEHLADPRAALREWLRVVRPGGHVCAVIPDTRYTRGQNTDPTPHLHEWAPAEFVAEVLGWEANALPWFRRTGPLAWCDAEVVSLGEACVNWSFHVVLQKR